MGGHLKDDIPDSRAPNLEPPVEPVMPGLEPARKTRRTGRTGILSKKKKEGSFFLIKNIPALPVLRFFLAGSSPGFTGCIWPL